MWRAGAGEGYREQRQKSQEPGLGLGCACHICPSSRKPRSPVPPPNPDLVAQGVPAPPLCPQQGFLVSPLWGTHSRALVTARGEKEGRGVCAGEGGEQGGSGEGVSSLPPLGPAPTSAPR